MVMIMTGNMFHGVWPVPNVKGSFMVHHVISGNVSSTRLLPTRFGGGGPRHNIYLVMHIRFLTPSYVDGLNSVNNGIQTLLFYYGLLGFMI